MLIERRVNASTSAVELWEYEWEKVEGSPARKVFLSKICDEQPVTTSNDVFEEVPGICWAYGRTLGNIAVYSPALLGLFPGQAGDDAQLPCDIVHAGKFRHGAERWWCRTHQTHWGTNADRAALKRFDTLACANHAQRMSYVLSPRVIRANENAELAVWCSLPAALAARPLVPSPAKIYVHAKSLGGSASGGDFDAVSVDYQADLGLFANNHITRVNITPPAAVDFVFGLERGRETSCINCSHCGCPHLDLGDFALKPHRKHFCGNCGRDSTWSKEPIVSTPLKPLHDQMTAGVRYEPSQRSLDLDAVLRQHEGADYEIRATTPAIIWSIDRPQETGIHVSVKAVDGTSVIDDTFGEVVLEGRRLERDFLFLQMRRNVII